jgi:hypothetical protein
MRAQREPGPFHKVSVAPPVNHMEVPHPHGTARLHLQRNKEVPNTFGASAQRYCGRATQKALRSVALSNRAEGHPQEPVRVVRAKRRVSFADSEEIIAPSDSMNKTFVPPEPSKNAEQPSGNKEGGARTLGKPSEGVVSEPLLEVPLPKAHSDSIAAPAEETRGA